MMTPAGVTRGPGIRIGVDLDTLTNPEFDWEIFCQLVARAGVTEVSFLVGCTAEVQFPWPAHEDRWYRGVSVERDVIATAIDRLSASDMAPAIALAIDVSTPIGLFGDGELNGTLADGTLSRRFPSVTNLRDGQVGAALIALCRAASERYHPSRIILNSLSLEASFDKRDEALFAEMTGQRSLPRNEAGDVDATDPAVTAWRAQLLTDLVTECSAVVAPGTVIDVEMRVNWDEPGADRSDSGHAYAPVLATGNAITLRDSFGLNDEPPTYSAQLVDGLAARFSISDRERVAILIALWGAPTGETRSAISAFDLQIAVESIQGQVGTIALAPLSILGADHWRVLVELREGRAES